MITSSHLVWSFSTHVQSPLPDWAACYTSLRISDYLLSGICVFFLWRKAQWWAKIVLSNRVSCMLVTLKFLYAIVPTIHHVQIQITVKCHRLRPTERVGCIRVDTCNACNGCSIEFPGREKLDPLITGISYVHITHVIDSDISWIVKRSWCRTRLSVAIASDQRPGAGVHYPTHDIVGVAVSNIETVRWDIKVESDWRIQLIAECSLAVPTSYNNTYHGTRRIRNDPVVACVRYVENASVRISSQTVWTVQLIQSRTIGAFKQICIIVMNHLWCSKDENLSQTNGAEAMSGFCNMQRPDQDWRWY